MAHSTIAKNFRDGTVALSDDTPVTPLSLTVTLEDGDVKVDGLTADGTEYSHYEDRGTRASTRKTKRKYPTFSLSAKVADIADAAFGTLIDACRKTGYFAAGISTTVAKGDVWTLDLLLTIEGTDLGDASDHTIRLNDCAMECSFSEGDPDTVTLSGTVYGTVVTT